MKQPGRRFDPERLSRSHDRFDMPIRRSLAVRTLDADGARRERLELNRIARACEVEKPRAP